MNSKQSARRRFLKEGAALAGLAVGAIRSASAQTPGAETSQARPKDTRAYGERSRFVTSIRTPKEGDHPKPPNPFDFGPEVDLMTPLQDLVGIITPSGLHFTEDHAYGSVEIDPREHRFMIHGMVDHPLIFTLEELQRLPSVSRIHFIECNANSRPQPGAYAESVQMVHGKTSCSEWTGVLLSVLLQRAGVQRGGSWLVAEGADPGKYTKSIPVEKAMDDVLVAYGQNGEPVRPENGYPLRLVVPGWEGINCTKWLRRIKVVDQPYMAKWESGSNTGPRVAGKNHWFQYQMGVKSVITRPSAGQRLPGKGFYEITGLAWSGGGAIRRVEVSTDGGRTWKDAQLQTPVFTRAHTRFRRDWNWNGEECVLQSRCTDEQGEVQPSLVQVAKLWDVSPDFFNPGSAKEARTGLDHFNAIQPWRVTRDGSVHNALFS